MKNTMMHGQVPPQATDVEQSVLGALMTINQTLDIAAVQLLPEMFYKDSNKEIFTAITELHKANKGVDMLTVVNKLKERGKLEDIGGVYYISTLTQNCFGSFTDWCAILKQKYTRREAIRLGQQRN
jgi:replicative DNA helicase